MQRISADAVASLDLSFRCVRCRELDSQKWWFKKKGKKVDEPVGGSFRSKGAKWIMGRQHRLTHVKWRRRRRRRKNNENKNGKTSLEVGSRNNNQQTIDSISSPYCAAAATTARHCRAALFIWLRFVPIFFHIVWHRPTNLPLVTFYFIFSLLVF